MTLYLMFVLLGRKFSWARDLLNKSLTETAPFSRLRTAQALFIFAAVVFSIAELMGSAWLLKNIAEVVF